MASVQPAIFEQIEFAQNLTIKSQWHTSTLRFNLNLLWNSATTCRQSYKMSISSNSYWDDNYTCVLTLKAIHSSIYCCSYCHSFEDWTNNMLSYCTLLLSSPKGGHKNAKPPFSV